MAKKAAIKIEDILPQKRATEASPEKIKELASDIDTHGLKHGVVIMDGVVLDGLARIEAYKLLGLSEIPVTHVDAFDEACVAVGKARTGEMSVSRALDFLEATYATQRAFVKHRRTVTGSTKAMPPGIRGGVSIRDIICEATGLSVGRIELALRLIRRAPVDRDSAEQMALIRAGTQTLYGYGHWLRRQERNELVMEEFSLDEVRTVMERGLRTLNTTVEMMSKFGGATVLTLTERQSLMDSLSRRISTLRKLSKAIREGMDREMMEEEE